MSKVYRSQMFKWMRNRRWSWTPAAIIFLIAAPFAFVVLTLWAERREFTEAVVQIWKVMTHQVGSIEDE